LLIVHLPEWLRGFEQSYVLITSLILLIILIAAPDGLAGLIERLLPEAKESRELGVPDPGDPLSAPSPGKVLMPSETPILSIQNVSKAFGGVQALDGVSISLMRGSITAVIGPNGSGKTTLLNCITGVYRPDSGRIVLGGTGIAGMPSYEIAARGVARTFQNLQLAGDMTVIDNVAIARFRAEGVSLKDSMSAGRRDSSLLRARAYAMAVLNRFGAGHVAFAKCGSLAHGTKRLVEIARAMCLEPTVLLLDEPAAGLNETEQSALAEHLQLLATQGLTLLIIEHNMMFLKTVATHMVCLDYGQVIASGRPQAIYSDKRVIEAYIGSGHLAEESS
jgi:branched-chain amino acid transport system permease protein